MYHLNGEKTLISINITSTKCQEYSGYFFVSDRVQINFCCFISNENHENQNCMIHYTTRDSYVKNSKFKNNSCKVSDETYGGLLSSSWDLNITVSECIFSGNIANCTFCASYHAIFTVINCFGEDLSAITTEYGSVYTDKMVTNSFDLTLKLLSLGQCEANDPFSFDFPLFPSKKKKKRLSINLILECLLNIKNS